MHTRRFPPPWSVEDIGAAFVVKDANGQQLCVCLFRGGARPAISGEVADEGKARRLAANIAKLPELLTRAMRTRF